jgi:predicted RNase H-like nuclease (RuvC/YqgF family)
MPPDGEARSAANSPVRELRKEIRDLKRALAEKAMEVDFFKGALQEVEARRQRGIGSGATFLANSQITSANRNFMPPI